MKFRVTFKDPDGPYDCIKDAVKESVAALGLTDRNEIDAVTESREGQVREKVSRWLKYGEYVTIEVDTEAMTATVVPTN
jgi:hypothetical protein